MRRILVVLGMVLLTAGVAPTDAHVSAADDPPDNFHFESNLIFESIDRARQISLLANGAEAQIEVVHPRTVVTMYVATQEDSTIWVYLHPCGSPVDRSLPAAGYAEAFSAGTFVVPVDSDASCVSLRGGEGMVTMTSIGYFDAVPGLVYQALAVPLEAAVAPVAPATTIDVHAQGVPPDADGVVFSLSAVAAPDIGLVWSLFECDGTPLQQSVTGYPGGAGEQLFIAPINASGAVCFLSGNQPPPVEATVTVHGYLADGATPGTVGIPYAGFIPVEAPRFVPLAPTRLLDTRDTGTPLTSAAPYRYRFTGLPSGTTAVALNITATNTSGPGFVSAYPCDAAEAPEVSNVNFTAPNQTVPNFALVSTGLGNEVCFSTLASTDLVVDLSGYFVSGAGVGFQGITPTRAFDTRLTGSPVAAGGVHVADLSGVIAADATAVVLNVTVTQPAADGYLTVFPCGSDVPTASNVNYLAGQTRPNLVTVALPPDKRICFYTLASAHLLADLSGWYTPSSDIGFLDGDPFRVFDTREPAGSPPLASGEALRLATGFPRVEALAWNVTMTQSAGAGYITGYPCFDPRPEASNVNADRAGATTANFALLRPDNLSNLCLYASTGTHLLADEFGYFAGPQPVPVPYEG